MLALWETLSHHQFLFLTLHSMVSFGGFCSRSLRKSLEKSKFDNLYLCSPLFCHQHPSVSNCATDHHQLAFNCPSSSRGSAAKADMSGIGDLIYSEMLGWLGSLRACLLYEDTSSKSYRGYHCDSKHQTSQSSISTPLHWVSAVRSRNSRMR